MVRAGDWSQKLELLVLWCFDGTIYPQCKVFRVDRGRLVFCC